jgi:hypothetical protein
LFIQFISGLVAEFKWCGFWAAVVGFVVGSGGAIAYTKPSKTSALAVQYF